MSEPAPVSDQELATRAAAGDHGAFDTLVRRHTARMYRVALRITGSASEAEDVVQEAWLSAWRALPGFRHESAFPTWLYRVTTNGALGQVRHRKPTVPLDEGDAGIVPGPEGHVVSAEQVGTVLRAIAELDVGQRIPLILREFEGMTYDEVAEVLEVSVPALRARLHRARVALLAKLGDNFRPGER